MSVAGGEARGRWLASLVARGERNDAVTLSLKIAFHTVLLGLLPFLVGGFSSFFVDVSQVSETSGRLFRFATALLLPVLLVQAAAIVIKVRREREALRDEGGLTRLTLLIAVHRHVRVLTDKGVGLFVMGLIAVALSLGYHFAELGILAVFGLATLYLLSTLATLLSTFVVSKFQERLATRGGSIGRVFAPVVAETGDSVEERFFLERVPIPMGFQLRVFQHLPARLATESRHVVGREASMQRATLTRALRRTPRGEYFVPPAEVAYADVLGLTRVSVAQSEAGQLKVLPRTFPVVMAEAPRVNAPEEGALSILRKLPSEDWFRFRDYLPGDDTRRIQWKLSVKLGRFQVRQPETVPVVRRRVRLVLDTWLPIGYANPEETAMVLGDLLDRLVELWLSIARALTERGEDVVLVLPSEDPARPVTELACKRGTQARWRDLGARAQWQGKTDFHRCGEGLEGDQFMVVVTGRFVPLPALPHSMGPRLSWVLLPAAPELSVLSAAPTRGRLARWFSTPFAAGAEENGLLQSFKRDQARKRLEQAAKNITAMATQGSQAAEAHLRARQEPLYKVSRSGAAYMLQG
ncbi:MAG: DUF58 domain-containing protein [Myxococcales bacterium]|nr:DUF58 domain-containing protein [Myxococcales bacterium]